MKRVWFVIALCMGVHTFMACSSWWTTPVQGPPTQDNPCGGGWHECSDHGCCMENWSCTVDRLPIEADPPGHGYCEDAVSAKRVTARKP